MPRSTIVSPDIGPISPSESDARPQGPQTSRRRVGLYAAALAVVTILGINLPFFLRMPLWCDVHYYDYIARKFSNGQALYRDVFDNNLPGIVWVQAGVRALVGWSPEAIRGVDFAII